METFPRWANDEIVSGYRERGLTSLFEWQTELLSNPALRAPEYANLLFSAPTSAGKTVVAELLAINTVLSTSKKALFVFPYVSVAREKFIALQKLWRSVNLRVRAYMGASSAPLDSWDAAVCTIEKANSLLNRAIDEGTLESIGVVVVDEFHMIFDSNRGQIIEHILAKLMYISSNSSNHIQVIAMSATIPSLSELAEWLKSQKYETILRPIQLDEGILINNAICDVLSFEPLRKLPMETQVRADSERVIQLCLESLLNHESVLIFCSSKAETEKTASLVSNHLKDLLCQYPQHSCLDSIKTDALATFDDYFRSETQSDDVTLLSTIPTGVAFHHAGLTMEEREVIEYGFRVGVLRILTATSTLSSGVNLPAQRVIIRAQASGPCALNSTTYRQMVGRAGRLGQSTKGESIVVCRREQLDAVKRVLQRAPALVLRSSLKRRRLKLIVEAVCSGLCSTECELGELLELTYFGCVTKLENDLEWLISNRLLAVQHECSGQVLRGTQLGRAVLASSLPPDIALLVYADLYRASRSLVLDTELHLLYLVTPLNNTAISTRSLDWSHYYTVWTKLPAKLQRVGQLVGISERFILERMQGRMTANNTDMQIHLRFISALALFELINERPLNAVARSYRINRGALQSLQQQSATYACMVVAFCERLGWVYLRSILDGFSERLAFGVRRELTELVKLDGLDARRARGFHGATITTIAQLATTPVEQVAKILRSAVPFVLKDDNRSGLNKWLSGENAMTDSEAATLVIARARQYLASSIRGLGVFSETQLSLLMSSASDERTTQRESTQESMNKTLESESSLPEVDALKPERSIIDDSLLELSTRDLFDHSSIYGEECFDERSSYTTEESNAAGTSKDRTDQTESLLNLKQNVLNDELFRSDEKVCQKAEGLLSKDGRSSPSSKFVNEEEDELVERIRKKMSRASISTSNIPIKLEEHSESTSKQERQELKEWKIKTETEYEEKPVRLPKNEHGDDHDSFIAAILDDCLNDRDAQNSRSYQQEKYSVPNKEFNEILDVKCSNLGEEGQPVVSVKIEEIAEGEEIGANVQSRIKEEQDVSRTVVLEQKETNPPMEWSMSDSALCAAIDDDQSKSESFQICPTVQEAVLSNIKNESIMNPDSKIQNESVSDSMLIAMLSQEDSESDDVIKTRDTLPGKIGVERNVLNGTDERNTRVNEQINRSDGKGSGLTHGSMFEGIDRVDEVVDSFAEATRFTDSETKSFPDSKGPLKEDLERDSFSQDLTEQDVLPADERARDSSVLDSSADIFGTSDLSSLAPPTPDDLHIKRARQRISIDSPLSPNCRSPMAKFVKMSSPSPRVNDNLSFTTRQVVKLSSPCSTSSPLAFPPKSSVGPSKAAPSPIQFLKTSSSMVSEKISVPFLLSKSSSSVLPKQEFSPKTELNSPFLTRASKRGEAIRVKNLQGADRKFGDEQDGKFSIDDVCRSESDWYNFVDQVSSWTDIGMGIGFGKSSNQTVRNITAVALCSSNGSPAYIPLDDSLVYGDETDEEDFPSCTPCDSIGIDERIRLLESILTSNHQRKLIFDLLSTTRALNSPLFSSDLVTGRISNCICIKSLSYLAHFRTANGEYPLSFNDLIARVLPSFRMPTTKKGVSSNSRVLTSLYAMLNTRLYDCLIPLATRLSSQRSINLEIDSIVQLARMEATGILFDRKAAEKMIQKVKSEMCSLEAEGRRLAEIPFDFDSPSEIANVLFVKMGITPLSVGSGGANVTNRRHYPTNKEVLKRLAPQHPIAAIILKWRKLNTALSSSLHLVHSCAADGRIRTMFTPFSQTGRVQSVHPNVQSVQKDALVDGLSVRSLFIAPPGFTLISADYGQLELRVLAGLCRDCSLRELLSSGGDLFQIMTARWNTDISVGVEVDRQKVKQLCYAIIYGMGATSLGEQIGMSRQNAERLINKFFEQFPKVRSWMDETLEKCRRDKCAVTILGRKRPLKDANSAVQSDRAKAERQAINGTIQGSASEIFKLALSRLEDELKELDAKIVMQVHDEVIVEVRQSNISPAIERIRKAMCDAHPELVVPLTVKISTGKNWGNLSPIDQ